MLLYKKLSAFFSQRIAIPQIVRGKDVAVQSETGSGKSVAFLLPILAAVEAKSNKTQVLVITPTRELAVQLEKVCQVITANGKANKKGSAIRVVKVVASVLATSVSCNNTRSLQAVGQFSELLMEGLAQRPHVVLGCAPQLAQLAAKGLLDLSHVR